MAAFASEVTLTLDGQVRLQRVSMALSAGEVVALVGAAGAGKTLLLKALAGLFSREGGPQVPEVPVGFAFQNDGLFDDLSAFDNVALPLRAAKVAEPVVTSRVAEILREVGLEGVAAQVPSQLSGGMRKRVGIARALVVEPQLALLDDPTAGLDPDTAGTILDLITTAARARQMACLFSASDLTPLATRVRRVVLLDDGMVRYDGAWADTAGSHDAYVREFFADATRPPLRAVE